MNPPFITKKVIPAILIGIFMFSGSAVAQSSYTSEKLSDDTVYNDFVVGPGKVQLDMQPGETRTALITVSNRLGVAKTFNLVIEDIAGSQDPAQTVVLLGSDRGSYSLKDYLSIASTTFVANHGERVTIPVTVHVPADAQPGGLYGSVLISTATTPASGSNAQNPVITRVGTLFFIRVAGNVVETGELSKFSLKNDTSILWNTSAIDFRLLYKNSGTVHLNPYGIITVKNTLGSNVGTIPVEPWFALPNSLRLREVVWNPTFLLGRYTATAEINRGYGDKVDTAEVSFWVIPWKILAGTLVALIIGIGGLRWLFSKFTLARK